MSDYSDDSLDRYLDGNAEAKRAYLEDPIQHAQIELQRQALDAADRAMASEGIPEDVRNRVVNRIVWGEPEGLVDVHAQRIDQAIAAYGRLSTRPRVVSGAS
jgi:hypothetical protein